MISSHEGAYESLMVPSQQHFLLVGFGFVCLFFVLFFFNAALLDFDMKKTQIFVLSAT